MRNLILVAVAMLLASCATAPSATFRTAYDHRTNSTSIAVNESADDRSGTGAGKAPARPTPGWYRYGHP